MRRFKTFHSGPEIVEVGRLDEPGVYLQIANSEAVLDETGGDPMTDQFTVWLTQEQAVNLAEYLLRCVRKNARGDKA